MFHQQYHVYELLNEFHPEREITKGYIWSQFDALDLLYVLQKKSFVGLASAIDCQFEAWMDGVCSISNISSITSESEIRELGHLMESPP